MRSVNHHRVLVRSLARASAIEPMRRHRSRPIASIGCRASSADHIRRAHSANASQCGEISTGWACSPTRTFSAARYCAIPNGPKPQIRLIFGQLCRARKQILLGLKFSLSVSLIFGTVDVRSSSSGIVTSFWRVCVGGIGGCITLVATSTRKLTLIHRWFLSASLVGQ